MRPIPMMKENIPVTVDEDEVRVTWDKIDDIFTDHCVGLIDECYEALPAAHRESYGRHVGPSHAAGSARY